jgi:hypothetical protein
MTTKVYLTFECPDPESAEQLGEKLAAMAQQSGVNNVQIRLASVKPKQELSDDTSLRDSGLGSYVLHKLLGAGYTTVGQIRSASDSDLTEIDGIKQGNLSYIREKL